MNSALASADSRRRRSVRHRPAAAVLGVLALVAGAFTATTATAAGDPCTTGGNPIVCENSKPGTDPDEWEISGAGDSSIQGFATDISVDGGDRIDFKIDTDARAYTIDVYRTGWYQGLGARHITSIPLDVALPQRQPECMNDVTTELYDCGNWAVSAHWNVPTDAVSGVYVARLYRPDTGGASHITFVVRDDDSRSDIVFQTSDPTWHAYNMYGGSDFYQGGANNRAYKLSYNRPFSTRGFERGRDFYFSSEYAMVRFLEQNGYDVSYQAGVDTDRYGSLLLNHKTFLSVGHDEYWSGGQRANVEAARDAGVNLAFFSGNEVYWHTRYEPAAAGGATPYRTLVSYKETWANRKLDPKAEWTGTWRDPRFASTANGAGRPENSLTGTMYMVNYSDLPLTVTAEEGKLRLWRGTDLTNLAPGTSKALAAHTVGYENDEDVDNGSRPAGLVRLSTTTGAVPEYLQDFGNTVEPGTTTHHATLYRAPSGALVFGAGTVQWAWGLDQTHDGDGAPADARMRQATMNLLADMGAQPRTPAAGLTATPASTDTQGPTATITSPTGGALSNGSKVTVTGTATDAGGGKVAGVEVSLDGGSTWHPATGRGTWSYTGIQHGVGANQIRARATDDSANIGAQSSVGVTVSCPCSVFGAETPATPSTDDTSAVELGMRFEPLSDGYVTGVRFYKGPRNTGTHRGALWGPSGEQLAAVTFTGESATGWQTAQFSQPVAVAAGVTYTASYTAPAGGYAVAADAFSSRPVDAYPLSVPGGFGATPAGVFGNAGTVPTQTWDNSAYYVDPVFTTTDDSPLAAIGQQPAAGTVSVPTDTTVSVRLSKVVDAGTVRMVLKDSNGVAVSGATTYDPTTRTVTFRPGAALAGFVTYTATVSATSTDGKTVGTGASWSFRTLRPASVDCPCGLYDESVRPGVEADTDPDAVTLGTRFTPAADGTVSAVQFYKGAASSGPYTVALWGPDGTRLSTATVTSPVTSGWQETALPAPVPVTAGQTYTVSYRTETGRYAVAAGGLAQPITTPQLATPPNGGAYTYGTGFPGTTTSTGYLVDVVYTPTPTVPTLSARTPADGAIDVDRATTVSVTASVPLAAGATLTLRDALGVVVAGTTTKDATGRTLTLDPDAALAAGAVYTASFAGTGGGTDLSSTWRFTTAAASGACPCTLFGSARPAVEADRDSAAVELGTVVVPDDDGYVTGVRFYKGAGNGGTHTGSLWSEGGTRLATATFTNETASGWQTATFSSPVPVVAGAKYVVSYLAPQGRYSYDRNYFGQAYSAGPLAVPVGGGRYLYGGGFPQYSYENANYWVDVVFTNGPLRVSSVSPDAGATGVPAATTVTARLSYAPIAADPVLALKVGTTAVAGTSSYDPATRRVTFTPSQALPEGVTVTATVTLAGDVLKTWSFTTAVTEPVPTGLWTDADTPASASWPDPDPVQVGTRITTTQAGTVKGVRFYQGPGNTGTHVGYLWSSGGTLLGTGSAAEVSGTGWRTILFDTPARVTAGQSFVASYWAPNGWYAVTRNALSQVRTVGPLSTLVPGGAYVYGQGFPSGTAPHSYWVDVLFVADR
ncbi:MULTISPECIES: DUF4082 domain-containing protein [unclassified Isoptericola]|uniref:DUF4082 domain-containing protein n=1 Tax=unclassified Isoptericola TaxID=2623355 RepID=UPI003646F9E5